jgi:hypothetical protein
MRSISTCRAEQPSVRGLPGRRRRLRWPASDYRIASVLLPTGVAGDILATADLRISLEAVRPDHAAGSDGLAEIPADLAITGPELTFMVQGWQTTTAILPLCATADPADLSPAGAPHLELYIQNEHRPNTSQSRQVCTLDMIDLSRYGQPRQDQPGDLSVGVTTPIRLSEKEIEALTLAALDRMTGDSGFTNRRPARASDAVRDRFA